jgi:hypothetical protein
VRYNLFTGTSAFVGNASLINIGALHGPTGQAQHFFNISIVTSELKYDHHPCSAGKFKSLFPELLCWNKQQQNKDRIIRVCHRSPDTLFAKICEHVQRWQLQEESNLHRTKRYTVTKRTTDFKTVTNLFFFRSLYNKYAKGKVKLSL